MHHQSPRRARRGLVGRSSRRDPLLPAATITVPTRLRHCLARRAAERARSGSLGTRYRPIVDACGPCRREPRVLGEPVKASTWRAASTSIRAHRHDDQHQPHRRVRGVGPPTSMCSATARRATSTSAGAAELEGPGHRCRSRHHRGQDRRRPRVQPLPVPRRWRRGATSCTCSRTSVDLVLHAKADRDHALRRRAGGCDIAWTPAIAASLPRPKRCWFPPIGAEPEQPGQQQPQRRPVRPREVTRRCQQDGRPVGTAGLRQRRRRAARRAHGVRGGQSHRAISRAITRSIRACCGSRCRSKQARSGATRRAGRCTRQDRTRVLRPVAEAHAAAWFTARRRHPRARFRSRPCPGRLWRALRGAATWNCTTRPASLRWKSGSAARASETLWNTPWPGLPGHFYG